MYTEKENQEIIDFIESSPDLAQARQQGVDLWALWANLQRTPEERVFRLEISCNMIEQIRIQNQE